METWQQNFNPLGNEWASTLAALLPVFTLFYFLAIRRVEAWKAAVYMFFVAAAVALFVFRMPASMVGGAVIDGLVYGWFRIACMPIAAVFVYEVSVASGQFDVVKQSISNISADRRIQVLLIAFAFGALLEGAGGGGSPVAITGSMMIGLGFPPFETAVMCLLANSAPVAFGGLGNPVRTLVAVTGLREADFSAMLGRILPLTTLVLPFWLVRTLCPAAQTFSVWPALLACGVIFGGIQFFWSNFIDVALVDIVSGIGTLALLAFFVHKVWKPRELWQYKHDLVQKKAALSVGRILWAWMPFALLAGCIVIWGLPIVSRTFEKTSYHGPVPGLHLRVIRMPPVVPKPFAEPALFDLSWLSNSGTGTFFAGLIAGPLAGLSLRRTGRILLETFWRMRMAALAIMSMLAVGFIIRYCGMDATMGMAMAHTGVLFPFFGTMIGWLGVALSGTDAGSNALFGSLQALTARKLGLSPILMGAANSAGGVMGKMISPQSLIIGCAATGQDGKEGALFAAVFKHSIALMAIVGAIVMLYAYVFPGAIPDGHNYW
jgi:lactate permease